MYEIDNMFNYNMYFNCTWKRGWMNCLSPLTSGDFILFDSNSNGDLKIIVGVLEKVTIMVFHPTCYLNPLNLQG